MNVPHTFTNPTQIVLVGETMCDVTCDTGIRNLRLGTGAAAFLANLLNPAAHNMHHFRVGSALCPGKRGGDWRAGDLARQGHASLLRIRLGRLADSADSESILAWLNTTADRKCVVGVQSGALRVYLGGCRIIKKKK